MPLVRDNSLLYEVIKGSTIDSEPLATIEGLSSPAHDFISLSYTSTNLTGVIYKTGGSGGTTVATLVLVYDGNNNLTSVTKS